MSVRERLLERDAPTITEVAERVSTTTFYLVKRSPSSRSYNFVTIMSAQQMINGLRRRFAYTTAVLVYCDDCYNGARLFRRSTHFPLAVIGRPSLSRERLCRASGNEKLNFPPPINHPLRFIKYYMHITHVCMYVLKRWRTTVFESNFQSGTNVRIIYYTSTRSV